MKYVSTRQGEEVALEDAIMSGTAPDGGLYVPTSLPSYKPEDFDGIERINELAAKMLQPFFAGSGLEDRLAEICDEAFTFDAPLNTLRSDDFSTDEALSVLELLQKTLFFRLCRKLSSVETVLHVYIPSSRL